MLLVYYYYYYLLLSLFFIIIIFLGVVFFVTYVLFCADIHLRFKHAFHVFIYNYKSDENALCQLHMVKDHMGHPQRIDPTAPRTRRTLLPRSYISLQVSITATPSYLREDVFYFTTHCIYGYMAPIRSKESINAPSLRRDSKYSALCYTSCGALVGKRKS